MSDHRERVIVKLKKENGVKWILPDSRYNKIKLVKETKDYVYYDVPKYSIIIMQKGNSKIKYPAYTFAISLNEYYLLFEK
jgi:hypothetical protein